MGREISDDCFHSCDIAGELSDNLRNVVTSLWGIYFTFSDYSERIEDYYDFSGLSEYDRAPDVGPLFRESDRKINSACGHFFLP